MVKNTMLDLATRRKICEETIACAERITRETPGATLEGQFIPCQLPHLSTIGQCPKLKRRPILVLDSDSFGTARSLLDSTPSQKGKLAVLNLASNEYPAGGWRWTLSSTQEEALCYSSTLYSTFDEKWYPWPNTGPGSIAGVFSPAVAVFRDTLDNDLLELKAEKRFIVSVLTVAAPCWPELTEDKLSFAKETVLEELREKIRLVYRMAAHNSMTSIVLGAMGCGAYRCPPALVAREMKLIMNEAEFEGWFEIIIFAIYAKGETGRRNLQAFSEEFGTAT